MKPSVFNLHQLCQYFGTFAKCVADIAGTNPDWKQSIPPDETVQDLHERIVNFCIPDLAAHPGRRAEVSNALKTLNGDWGNKSAVEHRCRKIDDLGNLCCRSLDEVRAKIRRAVATLLLAYLPVVPCLTRWLTCCQSFGWWLLGASFVFVAYYVA